MKSISIFIIVLITVLISGCETVNHPVPTAVPNEAEQSPVATVPTSTALIPSTSTPSAPLPTLTQMPTLAPENALDVLQTEIEKDSQCRLPCWLLLVPGQTQMSEVVSVFSRFGAATTVKDSPRSTYMRANYSDFYVTTEVYPDTNSQVSSILVNTSIQIKNEQVDFKNRNFHKTFTRFYLPEILRQYGMPDRVLLDTTLLSADATVSYPFVLWVIYIQKGFLIRYEGANQKNGDYIRICPMQSRIEIRIWDIKQGSYEEFIKNDQVGGISTGPKSIEAVTDLDLNRFHDSFLNSNLDTCFQTPISYWPH